MEPLPTPDRTDAQVGPSHSGAASNRRPGWVALLPALGAPPELTRRQWQVLALVGVASLFDQYDLALFAFALGQIQKALGIPEEQAGYLGSLVSFGALPSFLVTLAADRIGRRRVLLVTIAAYTLFTAATALAPDARSFVLLQILARTFAVAEVLLAVVVIAEEFAPTVRGWGIGALGVLQASGVGLASLAFGVVGDWEGSWRGLYALGIGPLLLLTWWRRWLPETPHFEALAAARASGWRHTVQPLRDLVFMYPGRFAASAAITLLSAISVGASQLFPVKYLQEEHGWSSAAVAGLVLGGGTFAIFGNTIGGRLSDAIGRKRVIVSLGAVSWLTGLLFYNAHGPWLVPLWIVQTFATLGAMATASVFLAELFPTSYRSTAAGARIVIHTLGAALGLTLESLLYPTFGSHWAAISWLTCASLPTLPIILLCFPETAGRSLDEVSPER